MIVKTANICVSATLFACIIGRVHGVYNNRSADDGPETCEYNHYWNGNVCTECPEGSHGLSCLTRCEPPAYGFLCSKTCDCRYSSCHYIYGCDTTTNGIEQSTTFSWMFTGNNSTTSENQTDRDKEDAKQTKTNNSKLIIFLTSGTVISILLLQTGREILKLHGRSETPGNNQFSGDAPVADNIYNEIL